MILQNFQDSEKNQFCEKENTLITSNIAIKTKYLNGMVNRTVYNERLISNLWINFIKMLQILSCYNF